ncbi:hypothetical protein KUF71_021179, partial [Frankliniella fusca]
GCGPPSPRLRLPDTSGRVTQPKLRAPPGCGSPSAMLRVGYLAGTLGWPSGLRLKISDSRVRIPLLIFYSISIRAQEACCYAR